MYTIKNFYTSKNRIKKTSTVNDLIKMNIGEQNKSVKLFSRVD